MSGVHFCSTSNSTHFTDCCEVAINDNESNCPSCGGEVPGDGRERHDQAMVRWYGRKKVDEMRALWRKRDK